MDSRLSETEYKPIEKLKEEIVKLKKQFKQKDEQLKIAIKYIESYAKTDFKIERALNKRM